MNRLLQIFLEKWPLVWKSTLLSVDHDYQTRLAKQENDYLQAVEGERAASRRREAHLKSALIPLVARLSRIHQKTDGQRYTLCVEFDAQTFFFGNQPVDKFEHQMLAESLGRMLEIEITSSKFVYEAREAVADAQRRNIRPDRGKSSQ